MFILTVIPIARGIFKDSLTYFTADEVAPGSLITIPVRGRTVSGLVVDVTPAQNKKAELKSQTFAIKKMGEFKAKQFLTSAFLQACRSCADWHGEHMGQVIATQVPSAILSKPPKASPQREYQTNTLTTTFALQESLLGRLTILKRFVRERFAKQESVIIVAPTIADVTALFEELQKGIETYAHILHGNCSDKIVRTRWSAIAESKRPVLLVCTPYFLSVPVPHLGCIILEHEHSFAYATIGRPHFDERLFARFLAEASGADLVLADSLLSLETLARYDAGEVQPLYQMSFRPGASAEQELVDMRKERKPGEPFRVLGNASKRAIANSITEGGSVFLLTHRKGLSPLTICQDCETVVTCPDCKKPLALFAGVNQEQQFRCIGCRKLFPVRDRCNVCTSWRFALLGIGTEKVLAEVEELFPEAPWFRVDADATPSHEEARAICEEWRTTPGAILIGTEMTLYYLREAIPTVVVVSLDALFALPNFRIPEKMLHLLLACRELANNRLIIQTRKADEEIFSLLMRGDLQSWYRDELALRAQFHYPPATVLVKITLARGETALASELEHLATRWSDYHPTRYVGVARGGQRTTTHLLLRIPRIEWPHPELVAMLRALPPSFMVQVDPENVL
ncbi:MAG: hypothetical protein COV10_02715 [Candidatus Vogelbacteria bacterium CG10_big_fil_rev_8_21_14_0_10_51_16]|uniref:Primosomal protein N' 3' DNA-binding domain-containing protein n=1 Tax=Candidatus Vogelbacteria bacterium CG10_big_fil_rev_8_21_14_0_10_51_16 TaxID=1975045 RepID=A0A2H0RDZ1_9BACT|nr:MAG: hypothetical protein COV10_02715 [Candidatus Vogelbacteria bacterium CG10_big_fil_rev_8_21_14_0_10_51_16]